MSAIGPKQTCSFAPHMSAFRGKADMTICACLLLRSLLGVKRTWRFAAHMSAFDPKRTSNLSFFTGVGAYRVGTSHLAVQVCALVGPQSNSSVRFRPVSLGRRILS